MLTVQTRYGFNKTIIDLQVHQETGLREINGAMTIYIDIIQTYRSGRIQKDRRYDTS
jgi:hypothetical protein